MRYQRNMLAAVMIVLSVGICSSAMAGRPKPFLPKLSPGWNEIDPAKVYPKFHYQGLKPACSNCPGCTSDKYTFFARKGITNKLVIYFQGGGACWDSTGCLFLGNLSDCTKSYTYNPQQQETLQGYFNDPDTMKGIFDTTNPRNPFKDWYFVYLPYCTGDLFWGASDHVYDYPDNSGFPPSWTIQHRGFVNFKVVLKWIRDNFAGPLEIFVAGSSAGGYGAIMNYPSIREAFPFSLVYVLGDAAIGVTGKDFAENGILNWNIQIPAWILGSYSPELSMQDIYTNIAAEYPFMKFAQYTTAYDGTQSWFYNLQLMDLVSGVPYIQEPCTWSGLPLAEVVYLWHVQMLAFTHGTAAVARNYRYYIGADYDHTILMSDKFYTENSAGGMPFSKWLKAMVENPFGVWGGPFQGAWKNVEAP